MVTGIEDRLTNLERSIRRWKLATASLLLLIGVACVVGAEKRPCRPSFKPGGSN